MIPDFPGLDGVPLGPLASLTKQEYAAYEYAAQRHGEVGQTRKFSGKPYILHPLAVAGIIKAVAPTDSALIQAAILHDVLEDTAATEEEVADLFGSDVLALVMMVTSISKSHWGSRKERKEIDLQHYAQATPRGMSLKLADTIHNCVNITRRSQSFARVYLPEKQSLVGALGQADPTLLHWAKQVIKVEFQRLDREQATDPLAPSQA